MRHDRFVKIAKALADATRSRMVQEIRAAGELTCSCMCDRFPLSQPTISHHVKTLEAAGVIQVRREGQFHILSLDEKTIGEFAEALRPVRTSSAVPAADATAIDPVPSASPAGAKRRSSRSLSGRRQPTSRTSARADARKPRS